MTGIVWWMPTRAGPTGAGPAIDAVAPAFPGPRDDRPVLQVSCQAPVTPRPHVATHEKRVFSSAWPDAPRDRYLPRSDVPDRYVTLVARRYVTIAGAPGQTAGIVPRGKRLRILHRNRSAPFRAVRGARRRIRKVACSFD
ncbi:hypothetical protein [Burkholderia gladioli]|uniref:hypothetical protein n=1 Tax=Burkholderia gladioli TaxID=28095 RepID=UPI0015E7B7BA|nr:hypothetical protein [Burkholderia gladioli]MBA1363978.1 hypothetical protein [Burkholderia gladioli]